MDWTFQQIEGPESDRKKLVLSGWSAPFGRPRKEPVIKELIKSRVQLTRYPGSEKQTRHAFGTNWESTELKGRWMSKAGPERAGDIADQWTQFVRDERTCRIAWGNIISWTGYIEELELGRESEHEIAWRMRIQLDGRDDVKRAAPKSFANNTDTDLSFIKNWLRTNTALKAPAAPDLSPDFLDSLDNLAAELNKPAALMFKLAGNFDALAKKTYSTLQHFRGAVTGMRTALLQMRETIIGMEADSAMLVRTAESDIAWAKYVANLDAESLVVLDMLNRMDRDAELAQKQEVSKFITARDGDTWESLAIRATGSLEKAGDIRSLNGARYGEKPVPGTSYFVQ